MQFYILTNFNIVQLSIYIFTFLPSVKFQDIDFFKDTFKNLRHSRGYRRRVSSQYGIGRAEQHYTLRAYSFSCLYFTVQLPGTGLASLEVVLTFICMPPHTQTFMLNKLCLLKVSIFNSNQIYCDMN